jgi:Uma2 family endonuclease
MHAIPLRQDDTFYPESDGQPMGETEIHRDEIVYLIEALKRRFAEAADVYGGGNLFLYYKRGDPEAVLCPDVMVARGVPKKPRRRIFKLWEEGKAPCLVIEVTSDSTSTRDHAGKKARYASLGIEEYFLYDPLGEGPRPQLQGFRLARGRYQPAALELDGSLVSRTTGVTLRMEAQGIRVVETATGRSFRHTEELAADLQAESAARRAAEEASAREAAARQAAEDEVSRLRREVERLSKKS